MKEVGVLPWYIQIATYMLIIMVINSLVQGHLAVKAFIHSGWAVNVSHW